MNVKVARLTALGIIAASVALGTTAFAATGTSTDKNVLWTTDLNKVTSDSAARIEAFPGSQYVGGFNMPSTVGDYVKMSPGATGQTAFETTGRTVYAPNGSGGVSAMTGATWWGRGGGIGNAATTIEYDFASPAKYFGALIGLTGAPAANYTITFYNSAKSAIYTQNLDGAAIGTTTTSSDFTPGVSNYVFFYNAMFANTGFSSVVLSDNSATSNSTFLSATNIKIENTAPSDMPALAINAGTGDVPEPGMIGMFAGLAAMLMGVVRFTRSRREDRNTDMAQLAA